MEKFLHDYTDYLPSFAKSRDLFRSRLRSTRAYQRFDEHFPGVI